MRHAWRSVIPALLLMPGVGATTPAAGADLILLRLTPETGRAADRPGGVGLRVIRLGGEAPRREGSAPVDHLRAETVEAAPVAAESIAETAAAPRLTVDVALGLRQDTLDWNIAHPTGTPNVLSELDWDRVRSTTLAASIEGYLGRDLWLTGRVGTGLIWDGRNRDSDWLEDNRQNEFSRSYQDVPGHAVLDLGLELAWRWPLGPGNAGYLAPLVGYAWSGQFLDMRDGVRVIAPVADDDGTIIGGTPVNEPFAGLDSTYDAAWGGPFVGLAGQWPVSSRWTLDGRLERHFPTYSAQADWNLRADFAHPVSFEHRGYGDGWAAGLRISWRQSERLAFHAGVDARRFRLRDGEDTTFFSDGTSARMPLNEVNWDALGVSVGLHYAW